MYTILNNTPSAGAIQWANVHIQYNGVSYTIANGYTNYKYIYWLAASPSTFVVSDTFPILGASDVLVFLNKSGIALVVPTATVLDGGLIVPGSIYAEAIAANTITSAKIAADAITASLIATGAVTADSIAANAIGAAAIAANVITGDKLVADAITAREIAAHVITANEIVAGTITAASGVIADAAITSAKIADLAVTDAKIANLAVTSAKIANLAVTDAKIANIDAGKITTGELNTALLTLTNFSIGNNLLSNSQFADVMAPGGNDEFPSPVSDNSWPGFGWLVDGYEDIYGWRRSGIGSVSHFLCDGWLWSAIQAQQFSYTGWDYASSAIYLLPNTIYTLSFQSLYDTAGMGFYGDTGDGDTGPCGIVIAVPQGTFIGGDSFVEHQIFYGPMVVGDPAYKITLEHMPRVPDFVVPVRSPWVEGEPYHTDFMPFTDFSPGRLSVTFTTPSVIAGNRVFLHIFDKRTSSVSQTLIGKIMIEKGSNASDWVTKEDGAYGNNVKVDYKGLEISAKMINDIVAKTVINSTEGLAFYQGATKVGGLEIVQGKLGLTTSIIKRPGSPNDYILFEPDGASGTQLIFMGKNGDYITPKPIRYLSIDGSVDFTSNIAVTYIRATPFDIAADGSYTASTAAADLSLGVNNSPVATMKKAEIKFHGNDSSPSVRISTEGNTLGSGTNMTVGLTEVSINNTIRRDVPVGLYGDVLYGIMGANDYYRVRVGGGSNGGSLEIATADDGNEPIVFRQYTGLFQTAIRTLTLLDASGNTSLPGSVSANRILNPLRMIAMTDLNTYAGAAWDGYKGFFWNAPNGPCGYGMLEVFYYDGGGFDPEGAGSTQVSIQRVTDWKGNGMWQRSWVSHSNFTGFASLWTKIGP